MTNEKYNNIKNKANFCKMLSDNLITDIIEQNEKSKDSYYMAEYTRIRKDIIKLRHELQILSNLIGVEK